MKGGKIVREKAEGNRTEVLPEDLHSKFRVFGEGLSAVREKVDTTFDLVGEMKQDIEIVKMDIAFIKTELRMMDINCQFPS
jgi:hypothetical protein